MAPTYTRGCDFFTPCDADTFEYQHCLICGEKFIIEKGKNGPTGFVEAVAGIKHNYDLMKCPNALEMWHYQAVHLMRLMRKVPSKFLYNMLDSELIEVLRTRKPTKIEFDTEF